MEYMIPAVLVVLAVGGFVTFLVLNATRKSGPVADGDEGSPGIGADNTPLGDTTQHAGEQTEGGVTTSDPESGAGARSADPDAAAHVRRPGEGEGAERLEFEGEEPRRRDGAERLEFEREAPRGRDGDGPRRTEDAPPASERLANRDA
ncbi:MAG TPA: hypothetical protein VKA57_08650 [Solirubrobacteraceae bacterium]|nr:hypothetical protein [Solirubrobacteraceae bacterium]